MNRLALIIKGHAHSESEEESDILFADTYYRFFNSIAGGAWDDNEIIFLNEPTIADCTDIINTLKPSYALTVLIGHGATLNDHQLFQLNKDTIIKPGQFVLDTPKQLIIVESCRTNMEDINWVDLENKIPMYKYGGYIRGHIDRKTSKHLYITRLNQCDNGVVVCFACSKNQSARNYYFSSELIQFAQNLFLDTRYCYMTFDIFNMMSYIIKRVNRKSRKEYGVEQTPEIVGNVNFPIAVSKFDLLDFEIEELNKKAMRDE